VTHDFVNCHGCGFIRFLGESSKDRKRTLWWSSLSNDSELFNRILADAGLKIPAEAEGQHRRPLVKKETIRLALASNPIVVTARAEPGFHSSMRMHMPLKDIQVISAPPGFTPPKRNAVLIDVLRVFCEQSDARRWHAGLPRNPRCYFYSSLH
jgi:hypothetical protein